MLMGRGRPPHSPVPHRESGRKVKKKANITGWIILALLVLMFILIIAGTIHPSH